MSCKHMSTQNAHSMFIEDLSYIAKTRSDRDVLYRYINNCGTSIRWTIIQWPKKWVIKPRKGVEEPEMYIAKWQTRLPTVWCQPYGTLEGHLSKPIEAHSTKRGGKGSSALCASQTFCSISCTPKIFRKHKIDPLQIKRWLGGFQAC